MPNLISVEEYVARRGLMCPYCSSKDIGVIKNPDSDYIAIEELNQEVSCNTCGSMWTEVYRLVRYDNFEKNARERLNGETKGHSEKE
jgi:uncharacterized Zn finger protein